MRRPTVSPARRPGEGRRLLVVILGLLSWLAVQGPSLAAPPSWLRRMLPSSAPAPPPLPGLDTLETHFRQVYPERDPKDLPRRSPGQDRAVVLIHGLQLRPFHAELAEDLAFRSWQRPGSKMVKAMGEKADVYAFAYMQITAVDQVASRSELGRHVRHLRDLGYREIILVGHSAGGLVARHLVEDEPDCGVTRVLQVCSPNLGCSYAKVDARLTRIQKEFLTSLSKNGRSTILKDRQGRRIPDRVQFLCVVGDTVGKGDGVVSLRSQWPADLQDQGIPMVVLKTTHFTVMRSGSTAERLAELVGQSHPRWDAEHVRQARKKFGDG